MVKTFVISLDGDSSFVRALLVDNTADAVSADLKFALREDILPEFVVRVRYTRGTIHPKVLRCQLQTNLGRCSKWFGEYSPVDGAEIFGEVFADPPGSAVVEVKVQDGSGVVLRTSKAPATKPFRRKSFLGIVTSSVSKLKKETDGHASVYKQATAGKLTKKMPLMPPSILSSQPSLLRLLTQDAVPCSVFEMLTKRGKTYDATLMDLFVLHEPNESIASISCERSPLLKTTIMRACLKACKKHPYSLARLMLMPNYSRGDRSIMQLLTDDEVWDDYERPSILRMLLFQEDKKESLLRLLLTRNPVLGTSISEIVLEGETSPNGYSLARVALEGNWGTGRLAKFLTDSPVNGKPALAKYLFAGAKNSIARKVLFGETDGKYSLLRLLLLRKPNTTAPYGFEPSLADVLGKPGRDKSMSLLDNMIQDNELGVNLARITFETTCRIKAGVLETFIQNDRTPSLLENGSILSDSGCTLAHLFLTGERENLFGMLRALLIGESAPASSSADTPQVTSILRLMCENADDGKPNMLMIVLQELLELFGNKKHPGKKSRAPRRGSASSPDVTVSTQLSPQAFLPMVLKISNRLRQMGPDFAQRWKASWQFVSEQVLVSVDPVKSSTEWKKTAPLWAKICVAIGRKRWSQCFVKFARIATILDQGHGNRFMLSQHMVSKVAKAGVSTGFGISKGIISVVSKSIPIPIASNALDGVHDILSVAEGVTHRGIDVATKISLGATDLAVQLKKKSSASQGGESKTEAKDNQDDDATEDDDGNDDDDGEDGDDDQILRALSSALGGEDDEE